MSDIGNRGDNSRLVKTSSNTDVEGIWLKGVIDSKYIQPSNTSV
jgi:hypothetical protein